MKKSLAVVVVFALIFTLYPFRALAQRTSIGEKNIPVESQIVNPSIAYPNVTEINVKGLEPKISILLTMFS